jgi:hypothetical protein
VSNRINAFIVVLEKDIHEDDAKGITDAIMQLRGVADVRPNVARIEVAIAEARVRQELGTKLWEVLYPKARKAGT